MDYAFLNRTLPEIKDLAVNDVGVVRESDDTDNILTIYFLKSGLTVDVKADDVSFFNIKETGDRFDFKVCDRCFKRLETKLWFENNRHKKDNLITKRPSCRQCRKLKNGKSITPSHRLEWTKLRPEDYSSFTCPICLKTTITGITKVVLDHNHHTGKVRGWLCESCNTGIGRFDDDPEMVKRAVSWLENN